MKKALLTMLAVVLAFGTYAQKFEIDGEHTAVTSKVERFGMVKVIGRFNKVEGTITYDSDPSKMTVDVVITTDSYTANNSAGENAVKGTFLNVAQYPEITFKSESISKQGDGYKAKGELTIHGTTNTVEFPFKMLAPRKSPRGLTAIAVSATLVINRQDYGITFNRPLPGGGVLIGNEVEIGLDVLAIQQ